MSNLSNPKLHPTLASPGDLPDAILFVISTIDILLDEQLDMVERLSTETPQEDGDAVRSPKKRRYEKLMFEGQWHGWLECMISWCSFHDSLANKAWSQCHLGLSTSLLDARPMHQLVTFSWTYIENTDSKEVRPELELGW